MERSRSMVLFASGLTTMLACVGAAQAQCEVLVQESFRLGLRPHGGNGDLRPADLEDKLNGFWTQVPGAGLRWISNDGGPGPVWQFAITSSDDPTERDLLDVQYGIAWGEPGAVALLPFTVPQVEFSASLQGVMFNSVDETSALRMGYTSSPDLVDNFETHAALWLSLDIDGNWSIRANGNELVAAGAVDAGGTLNTGWLTMRLTFDPVSSMVSGRVCQTLIPPMPVTLTKPISYFAMESHGGFNAANALSIVQGTPATVQVQAVTGTNVCRGQTVVLHATTDATGPAVVNWTRQGGWTVFDGVQPSGAEFIGATTDTLTIVGATPEEIGDYSYIVFNDCGVGTSNSVTVLIGGCAADFDCSGSAAVPDIFAFLSAWFAGDSRADIDGAPGINVPDIFAFLSLWFVGC